MQRLNKQAASLIKALPELYNFLPADYFRCKNISDDGYFQDEYPRNIVSFDKPAFQGLGAFFLLPVENCQYLSAEEIMYFNRYLSVFGNIVNDVKIFMKWIGVYEDLPWFIR